MTHPTTTRLSSWRRLLIGLALLLGLCALTGGLARPAHAASTLSVSNCSSDAQLQAAVAQANRDNAGEVISFACSGDIKLTRTLTITGSMTLSGSGQNVTLDGGGSMMVLDVVSGSFPNSISVTLNALTVAHGIGGLDNGYGNVTVSNSTFDYNTEGPAIVSADAASNSSITISNSTIADNTAPGSGGGAIFIWGGTATISNSTITGNSNPQAQGPSGITNLGNMTISNSTIADNSGLVGLNNGGNLSMSGSIVADNMGGSDCFQGGFSFADNGYNLDSDGSCGFTGTGDLQNTNPRLGPLASNGGPTQTMAVLKGSPASDVIPLASGLCPKTDQRGHKRPDNSQESACDMGAFES